MMYSDQRQGSNQQSPMKPMDSKAEKELMEKVAALQQEFASIDVNHDQWISKEELYNYLDKKSGTRFDRAIADEIFDRMDKNHDNQVTINEFIKVYIEADEMLRRKIEAAKINKESYKRQQEECMRKAEKERLTEQLTAYGIAHNSMVHITVLAASDLPQLNYGETPNPYVEVTLNDQERIKTRIASGARTVEWDEKINFDIVNPESYIKFLVFDSRLPSGDSFLGETTVRLSELQDQNQHEAVLDLFDEHGSRGRGQLHLKLQWIHSKAKYFAMISQKWQDNYNREDEELQEYERYLKTIYQPFPALQTINRLSKPAPVVESKMNLPTFPGAENLEAHFSQLMTRAAMKIAPSKNPNQGFWVHLARLLLIAELGLAIVISFDRNVFFDVAYTLLLLSYIDFGMFREILSLRLVALAIFASVFLIDLVWLFFFAGKWGETEKYDTLAQGGAHGIIDFLTFANLFVKAILAMLVYMVDLQYTRQRASVPRVVVSESSPQRNTPNRNASVGIRY